MRVTEDLAGGGQEILLKDSALEKIGLILSYYIDLNS